MQELFGLSMDLLMAILLAVFLAIMAVVVVMAWRNRVMLKLGIRNIPRRRAQTILIVVGSMLSAVIMAAAFGTGDTLSFSIRSETLNALGATDEILRSNEEPERLGANLVAYMPRSTFDRLLDNLPEADFIDGVVPAIGERVPSINLRTFLTEGQLEVTAVDPDHLQGFGSFTLVSGGPALLQDLSADGVYINEETAEELDAWVGDRIRLFLQEKGEVDYTVEGIVKTGGLAGIEPNVLMSLASAQDLFDKPGQINFIAVSNKGGDESGVKHSKRVTKALRVYFADGQVAQELKDLLNRDDVLGLLEEREAALSGTLRSDVGQLRRELQRAEVTDELVRVLADDDVRDEVLDTLNAGGLVALEGEVDTSFQNLSVVSVNDVKRRLLELADVVGSGVTSFFIILGLFSVMVGILLIFLIFVMLAAARRTEMGMVRALGAKRSHLVQMFVFEGTAYDLAAAAVGTTIGLAVSLGIVALANRIFANSSQDAFSLTYHIELRSAIVAYCLGMIITFVTVAISAYRVSRMNIVEAVRGLPETVVLRGEDPVSCRLISVGGAVIRPILYLIAAFGNFVHGRYSQGWLSLGRAVVWLAVFDLVWLGDVVISLVRLTWPYLRRGWLTLLLGVVLMVQGAGTWNQVAPFFIGISLIIIGVGLTLRVTALRWPKVTPGMGLLTAAGGVVVVIHAGLASYLVAYMVGFGLVAVGVAMAVPFAMGWAVARRKVIDRSAFTFVGVVLLAFWILPFDTMEPVVGALKSDIEMFFVSGILMVAAAVWTVMYNADLMLRAATFLTSRIGKLRPVLVIAVAYAMSAKFRTGLTLAMFALVIFTLIVMSILTEAFGSFAEVDEFTGNWDIEATVALMNPVADMRSAIAAHPDLSLESFEAVGGYMTAPVQARQVGAESQRWESFWIQATDEEFLSSTAYEFELIAEGYGETKEDVWQALTRDPSLAVIDSSAVPSEEGGGFEEGFGSFEVEGLFIQDDVMSPIEVQILEPRTDTVLSYTVIGVLDFVTDNPGGLVTSKASVEEAVSFPIPLTTYRFRTVEGVDIKDTARRLEASFLENGMDAVVLEEVLEELVAANRAFNNLFTGYMGLGLVVGVAALGVISMRAVVERRQQIGMLRALGYRQGMIQLSFLLESSFVSLLGVALGVALGSIISFNIVEDIKDDIEGIRFAIPWLKIGVIIGIAYLFSLLTTYLPARQAARTHPAEALRYE